MSLFCIPQTGDKSHVNLFFLPSRFCGIVDHLTPNCVTLFKTRLVSSQTLFICVSFLPLPSTIVERPGSTTGCLGKAGLMENI